MPEPSTNILDHIVHLTPPGTLEKTCQEFRDLGFHVIPGGEHLDGMTANALVVFQDGAYLELICFTHPISAYPPSSPERHRRENHPWTSLPSGWSLYAFLGTSSLDFSISALINARAQRDESGVVYQPEMRMGRVRPDGRAIQFILSVPNAQHGTGILPFFCGDATPRKWRVPTCPSSNMHHPCGAQGIAHVRILVAPRDIATVAGQLTTVVGKPPHAPSATEHTWILNTAGGSDDARGKNDTRLILSVPCDEHEQERLKIYPGIFEVGLWVENGDKKDILMTPYGRLVFIPCE